MLNFIPVGRLVVTSESDLPLDYGVEAINRNAIMGEQGVQKRAQHAALWYTGVYRRVVEEEQRLSKLTDWGPEVQRDVLIPSWYPEWSSLIFLIPKINRRS